MSGLLTIETFRGREGDTFVLHATPEHRFDFALEQVRPLGHGSGEREPFALDFRGPREPVLAQRIYRLTHAEMDDLDIFIVPLGVDAEGARYEAIFT